MSDGIYLFPRCVVTDAVGLGSAASGSAVSRDWGFTCNGKFSAQSLLAQGTHDPRNYVVGNDCEVVVNGVVMSEATVADATFTPTNVDHVPLGTRQTLRRPISWDIGVKLTEWKTRDSILFQKFAASMEPGAKPFEVDILVRQHGPAS